MMQWSVYVTGNRTCTSDQFQCKYVYKCIEKSQVDDGTSDCTDESDEQSKLICCHFAVNTVADIHAVDKSA